MPPKKRNVIIDGVSTTEMTRKKLETLCLGIRDERERTREERDLFQIERTKIRTFWEITRNELEETRAKIRNKESQLEETMNKNDEELKLFRQKVKHIQYECLNDLTEKKVEYFVQMKSTHDDLAAQEGELEHDKKELEQKFREQDFMHQEQIKELKIEQSRQISEIQKEFEKKAKELEKKYDKRFDEFKQDLNSKFADDLREVEERKFNQIQDLAQYHQKEFNDMKTYYNDITLNNLAKITSLEAQMEALRTQNVKIAKILADITTENRQLTEEFKEAKSKIAECQKLLENQEQDVRQLRETSRELSTMKAEIDKLLMAYMTLEMRYEKLNAQKDVLDKRFKDAVLEVQQKTGVKNVLLQKKLEFVSQAVGMKKLPQDALKNGKFEALLEKDSEIDGLLNKLDCAKKAYDDLLNILVGKMKDFDVLYEVLLPILPENIMEIKCL